MLYRIAVESWLHCFAVSSIFLDNVADVIKHINWNLIESTLEPSVESDRPGYRHSPHLMGMHRIYQLMLQLTFHSRSKKLLEDQDLQCSLWSTEIDQAEDQLERHFLTLSPPLADIFRCRYKLHIHALRIFHLKLTNSGMRSSTSIICAHVDHARILLSSRDSMEFTNPTIAWLSIVFACAAHNPKTFKFFERKLCEFYGQAEEGHSQRVMAALRKIRQRRGISFSHEDQTGKTYDGLELLVQQGGILASDLCESSD